MFVQLVVTFHSVEASCLNIKSINVNNQCTVKFDLFNLFNFSLSDAYVVDAVVCIADVLAVKNLGRIHVRV